MKVIIGFVALFLGFLALFAVDAFGLDDYLPAWLTDVFALIVMFILIAVVARSAPSKEHRPRSP